MRQQNISEAPRLVVLAFVIWSMLLVGCDSKLSSGKATPVLAVVDNKTIFEKKLATFRQKAEAGDAIAQLEMGRAYEQGIAWAVKLPTDETAPKQIDPLVDLKKAAGWYEKAAIQGNAEAQYRLGMLWLPSEINEVPGSPQPRDAVKAATWFEKAAKQKHAKAAYQLARLYQSGNGVEQNIGRAFNYYSIAADKGYAEAQYAMGWFYKDKVPFFDGKGGMELVTQPDALIPALAAEWWSKAAAQGHVGAQNQLGYLYFRGEGVPKDPVQANKWWGKAADQGDAEAQNNLGSSYSTGLGVPKDAAKAFKWFLESATHGEQAGQSNLARQYGTGNGVDRDMVLAYA